MNPIKKLVIASGLILCLSVQIGAGEWVVVPPKLVALTFDDGPRPISTPKFLSILKRNQVRATFFVVGKMAEKHPEFIEQMLLDGHEVSNHTWSHPSIHKLSKKGLQAELNRTQAFLRQYTGRQDWFFRPPGGSFSEWSRKGITPQRYRMILWNVHGHDQDGITADQIVANVLRPIKDNDIILLHNGLGPTAQALEKIIPELKRRGYVFVPVSTLIKFQDRRMASVHSKIARR